MFDTILVPLDGSPHAEAALPYAAEEARYHGAELVMLGVVPRPEPCLSGPSHGGPLPWRPSWPPAEIDAAERQAAQYLARVVKRHHLPVATPLRVAVGAPDVRIGIEAGQFRQPLVVMTTGDGTLSVRPPLSEVARRLMVAGTVPVLGVRQAPPVVATAA
jgi:nucleotide-binding universal stress UspA family protein